MFLLLAVQMQLVSVDFELDPKQTRGTLIVSELVPEEKYSVGYQSGTTVLLVADKHGKIEVVLYRKDMQVGTEKVIVKGEEGIREIPIEWGKKSSP